MVRPPGLTSRFIQVPSSTLNRETSRAYPPDGGAVTSHVFVIVLQPYTDVDERQPRLRWPESNLNFIGDSLTSHLFAREP